MKKRTLFLGLAVLTTIGIGAAAYVASPTVHSGNPGESPELGVRGDYSLGTLVKEFTLKDRASITAWGAITGQLKPTERVLPVRFWYPATPEPQASRSDYTHTMEAMRISGNEPLTVVSQGVAVAGAAPITDKEFPLILMSHGYGGWSTQFSYLAEHIASKGYVVASIDHLDQFASGVTSAILSFGNVLLARTQDQRQVLAMILADAQKGEEAYASQIDQNKIGLVGYSMGGYGALTTSGAPYSFDNDPLSSLPEAAKQALKESALESTPVKALVAFAPWGAQPENRVWTAEALANIHQPVLLVSGDQDDIVNYEEGVTWLFDNLTSAERYMLVYREARHNVVGNSFQLDSDAPFAAHESLREPVWRQDRLNAINQHFLTAFLDLYLKGNESKASYLQVPSVDSNAGTWPLSFGEQLNGKWAADEQTSYWKGFQRRWAAGIELHHAPSSTP